MKKAREKGFLNSKEIKKYVIIPMRCGTRTYKLQRDWKRSAQMMLMIFQEKRTPHFEQLVRWSGQFVQAISDAAGNNCSA